MRNLTGKAIVTLVLTGVLLLGAGAQPASAALPSAGIYSGILCTSRTVENRGAGACWELRHRASNKSITVVPAAYDFHKDGYSSKADLSVRQFVNGRWTAAKVVQTVINSAGRGTTRVGTASKITRASGATSFSVILRVCTYDAPTKVHKSCYAKSTTSSWRF